MVNICVVNRKDKRQKDVDIIVLSHNVCEITKDFIDVLYKNTDVEMFNLIFIDNGSIDDTPNYLQELYKSKNNMLVAFSDENLGCVCGRNLGFTLREKYDTDASLILFLDNDQFVSDGWLEQHISVLDHGYDIVGVEAWKMSKNFTPIKKIEHIGDSFSYVGAGGMLMRSEVYRDVGMFDKMYNPLYFEDPDYIFRAYWLCNFKIGWNASARVDHFPHQTTTSMDRKKVRGSFNRNIIKFRQKWSKYSIPNLRQDNLPEFEE